MAHKIMFVPSGRGKARCAPNPDYPNGIAIVIIQEPKCKTDLPYLAPECGHWHVECGKCGLTVAITAAGRPDDPISVEIPCQVPLLRPLEFRGKLLRSK